MNSFLLFLALLSGPDGGFQPWPADSGAKAPAPKVAPEDQEVVKNLELLEHLDETADLDLLQELSVER